MKTIKLFTSLFLVLLICGYSTLAFGAEKKEKKEKKVAEKPVIQIAILLDTSNSMDGLINQAKSQLWKIVNELATTKRNGQTPALKVALFEYGKSSLPRKEGHLRMILPLTNNLDKVSEELFNLKTRGGQEYCGWVIKEAVETLKWSKSNQDFKAIYICGNEPFTQGKVDFRESCRAAINKSIIVNTIFCGPRQKGISTKWEEGSRLADGSYMNINQDRQVTHISSPYDKKIAKLGRELNKTYIGYGQRGRLGKARQKKQDSNAAKSAPGSETQRAISKSSGYYNNASWDLVDAWKKKKLDLDKIKKKDLPKNLRDKSHKEIKEYLKNLWEKRQELKKKIQELNKKRKTHVAKKRKKLAEKGEKSLDEAMIDSLKKQLKKKNYTVGK